MDIFGSISINEQNRVVHADLPTAVIYTQTPAILSPKPNPDEPEKCLKCAKMPKIMVSLQASPSATTRQVAPSLL
jgi:hypothetical protein